MGNDQSKMERYWEVQRIITQLNRFLKNIEKEEKEAADKKLKLEEKKEDEKLEKEKRILLIEQEEILKIQEDLQQQILNEKFKIENLKKDLAINKTSVVIDYEEEFLDNLTEEKLDEKLEIYLSDYQNLMKENEKEKRLYMDTVMRVRIVQEGLL